MSLRIKFLAVALCLLLPACTQHQKRHGYTQGDTAQLLAARSAGYRVQRPLNLRGALDRSNTVEPSERAARATPSQTPIPVRGAGTSAHVYRLDSGDRLRIVVFGQDNLSRSYSVDGSGFISMPLIGAVGARGLTTFALEERIASKLRSKYVKDARVTVEVQEYRPFFILGEVRRPGQFPYVNGMTIRTAVAIAGGYTERARERKVKLTRRVNGQDITSKVSDNAHVRPGDTIYVTERFF